MTQKTLEGRAFWRVALQPKPPSTFAHMWRNLAHHRYLDDNILHLSIKTHVDTFLFVHWVKWVTHTLALKFYSLLQIISI